MQKCVIIHVELWNILDFAQTCNSYSSATQHSKYPSYNTGDEIEEKNTPLI